MTLSISFAPQIVAFGKASSRQFSRDEIETISTTMNSVVSLDDAGNIRFGLGAGPVGAMDDALTMLSVGMGAPVTAPTSTAPSIPSGANATARALAANAAIRDGQSASRLTEAQALVDEHGSPWNPRTISRTRQALVRNLNPDLAARLVQQAGASL